MRFNLLIEFRNVKKVYPNGNEALDDVSFKIESGEFVFCIGESGAGKSTVIRLLTCEERLSSGTVIFENYELSRLQKKLIPDLRRKIGIVFQDFRLIETKTVFENVAFAMEIVGASKEQIKRRVAMVLSVVNLKGKADSYPSELSGGEAQRVGVARAMINNPGLIVADEPTGNLDPANGEAILALLEEINRAGTTVFCCTHDVSLVDLMKKRVIELEKGKIIRDEAEGSYSKYEITDEELNLDSSELDVDGLLDPTFLSNMQLMDEESQIDRAKKNAELKLQINEDSRRRRNRMSLAERITRMRILAENMQEDKAVQAENTANKIEKTNKSEPEDE